MTIETTGRTRTEKNEALISADNAFRSSGMQKKESGDRSINKSTGGEFGQGIWEGMQGVFALPQIQSDLIYDRPQIPVYERLSRALETDAEGVRKLQDKTRALLETKEKALDNPFLDKEGKLVNRFIKGRQGVNSSNAADKVKDWIQAAARLAPNVQKLSQPQKTAGGSRKMGYISAKYETGGWDPGLVSDGTGDAGGISYGLAQFSTATGSAADFVNWLQKTDPKLGTYFDGLTPGTDAFGQAWKKAYADFGSRFANDQTTYAYSHFVQPLVNRARAATGVDYTRSPALLELVYATAIQFGGGSLGMSALGDVNASMSDKELIDASYSKKIANVGGFFSGSSAEVQSGVKSRFEREWKDVLALAASRTAGRTADGIESLADKVGSKIANTGSYHNDAAWGQCVWYVRGRMKEKLGKDTGALGNANEMWYNAPERTRLSASEASIRPNTVASYKVGSSGSQYGHVIYIEAVDGDTVYFTEGGSGYHKSGTDGVVKKTTKQDILNGTGGFGSGLIGFIDINTL